MKKTNEWYKYKKRRFKKTLNEFQYVKKTNYKKISEYLYNNEDKTQGFNFKF